MPVLTQPDIYFGIHDPVGCRNTKQPELDYQVNSGKKPVNRSRPTTTALVACRSEVSSAAWPWRFDWATSTSSSRTDLVQEPRPLRADVQQMPKRPRRSHLRLESYAVIANGEVQYVLDGYTTTISTLQRERVEPERQLGRAAYSFNYVRNSVKVVVNAYSGAMTFYANDPTTDLEGVPRRLPSMFHR